MVRQTKDLRLRFLGVLPVLKDEELGELMPQEITSFHAITTFVGKSLRELVEIAREKNQDIVQKCQNVQLRSTLVGHASMGTSVVLALDIEQGSKFLDSILTGIVFSSALMASGRRTTSVGEEIVFPTEIFNNPKAKEIYSKQSIANINLSNFLYSKGVEKDQASKILQYGLKGAGLLVLPVESIISLLKEYEYEEEWMPEEVKLFLDYIAENAKKWGIDWLYNARQFAPRDAYPYPNIFKNPEENNLARDLVVKYQSDLNTKRTKIINCKNLASPVLRKEFEKLEQLTKQITNSKENIKNDWYSLLEARRRITRDYNLAVEVDILSSVSWRVWGEKKRHRTIPQIIDSIYFSTSRTSKVFNNFEKGIKNKNLSKEYIDVIDRVFSIPPAIKKNEEFLYAYLQHANSSLKTYDKLVQIGIKPKDAIFIIPRGIRIDILQSYNLYNLISGYFPLRSCITAEEELRQLTRKEIKNIQSEFGKIGLDYIAKDIRRKCELVGFCSETESCGNVKSAVSDYDDEFHKEMHEDLKRKYNEILKR